MGTGYNTFGTSSFMYKKLRFLLSTFPNELSNGWYVVTRGILFDVLFWGLLLITCNIHTFLISDSSTFLG